MFLRKEKRKDRLYLSIVHGYREKDTGKSKQKTILTLGYLDELKKQYDDPIAHFTEVAKAMTEEYNEKHSPVQIKIDPSKKLSSHTDSVKNFGYAALAEVYHSLELNTFLQIKQRSLATDFNLNSVFKLLVYGRAIFPGSKKHTYENKHRLFDRTAFSLDDVYRSLTYLAKYDTALQKWIHDRIKKLYGRDTSVLYYDVTNYYFEIDEQDELRKKGVSKEHRPDPIVQMGLFIDSNGLPVSYDLFAGNTNDVSTLRPALKKAKDNLGAGKVIIVADKGINSGDNLYYTLSGKNGYIVSMSIRNASKEIKDYVLDEDGYTYMSDEYKRKSRLCPRQINLTQTSGKKKKISVDEKQVVFYSDKYARRARAERQAAVAKAVDLIKHPGQYSKATSYGAAKYVKGIRYDKDTGEISQSKEALCLDEELIRDEEKFDGYYMIVTNEMDKSDDEIIDIYRGLWKIEESFKITKSSLCARPVFVSRQDHIKAHFLICFTTLTLLRILEMKTGGKYCVERILESLRKSNYTHMESNYYVLGYYDDVLEAVGKATGIDFSFKYRTLSDIKKITGSGSKSS